MARNIKRIGLSIGVAATLSLGAVAAYAAAGQPSKDNSPVVTTSEVGADHPECYDTAKINDPNDFCYQTIGPWNSRLLSDDEVRSVASLEQMISAGHPTDQIQRYYPEYTPERK